MLVLWSQQLPASSLRQKNEKCLQGHGSRGLLGGGEGGGILRACSIGTPAAATAAVAVRYQKCAGRDVHLAGGLPAALYQQCT
jgi:hypothetical protein